MGEKDVTTCCALPQFASDPVNCPGRVGSMCASPGQQSSCGQGLVCGSDRKCIVPLEEPNLGNGDKGGVPNVKVPPDASTNIPGANPAWCNNDPNLEYSNGVCLPKSDFFPKTGIAGSSSLSGLMLKIIQLLLTFAGVIGVLILVVGGFWYLTSAGNDEQAEKGKKAIMNAIIGLVVVMLAYAIVTVISSTLISDTLVNK